MPKTLEDILKESETGSVHEALGVIAKALREEDDAFKEKYSGQIAEMNKSIASIISSLEELSKVQASILAKPDPVFPELKEFPTEIAVKKPNWYKNPVEIDYEKIGEIVYQKMAGTLRNINKRPIIVQKEVRIESAEIPKTEKVSRSAGGAVRRTAQWNIFTYPHLSATRNITSAGDGFTYYLDNALVVNSEIVKLNGGSPLSQGVDYTFTGNKLVFVQNQTGSQIEVRGQNK